MGLQHPSIQVRTLQERLSSPRPTTHHTGSPRGSGHVGQQETHKTTHMPDARRAACGVAEVTHLLRPLEAFSELVEYILVCNGLPSLL